MAAPLLIGDKVVIRTGGLAGKEGRVADFTPEGKIYVYVRTVNE